MKTALYLRVAAALLAGLLASCGVITETDFPGCDPTGSPKMYRGPACARVCKSEYSHCSNGKRANPDDNCNCSAPIVRFDPPTVPDTIGSSCACRYDRDSASVSLHQTSCRDWYPYVLAGQTKSGFGRPIGSGEDSTCTHVCEGGGGTELRGTFQFLTTGPASCREEALVFPGTIVGDYVSGGETASASRQSSAPLAADAGPSRVGVVAAQPQVAQRDVATANAPVLPPVGAAAPGTTRFKMQERGVDCRAECTAGGEYCASFSVDSGNAEGVEGLLAMLPAQGTAKRLALDDLRGTFANVTSTCPHQWVDVAATGVVRSIGAACEQALYLRYPAVEGFASSLLVPPVVEADMSASGMGRQFVFRNERQMMSLKLQPQALQRLYGGKIRYAAVDRDRVVIETQNRCLSASLQ